MGLALLNTTETPQEFEESVAFRHRPVDLAHLSRYTKGDSVTEREVLERFRRQARAHFDRLRHAKDDNAWRDAANLLKTSARAVGAWQILNSAETAERVVNAGQGVRDEVLTVLEGQIEDACAFVATVLES